MTSCFAPPKVRQPLTPRAAADVVREVDRLIGQRLSEARHMAGMTQETLANALGISFQSVQRYEAGASIGAGRLFRAAEVLGVSLRVLVPSSGRASSLTLEKEGDAGVPHGSAGACRIAELFDAIPQATSRLALIRIAEALSAEVARDNSNGPQ